MGTDKGIGEKRRYIMFSTDNIPFDETKVSDDDVFQAFDYSYPGLEGVKKALDLNDKERAKKELVHYFETRSNVTHFYDYRQKPLQKIDRDVFPYMFQASLGFKENIKDFCIRAGKAMMENVYLAPGRDNRWEFGPNFENEIHYCQARDAKKCHRSGFSIFSRGQFLEYLMFLYHETGDKCVLDKYEEVLKFFFKTYPIVVEDFSAGAGHLMTSEDRDYMNLGWLCFVYTEMLYTRMTYDIDYTTAFELIKHLWFCAMQFRRLDSDRYKPYNHHYFERGITPFFLSLMFPEIPDFREVREKSAEICIRHIREDYNEDGGYNELSLAYWFGAAVSEMLYRNIAIADLNGYPLLDDDMRGRINKTFDVLFNLVITGDRLPSIGDNGGPKINPLLSLAYKITGNEKFLRLLSYREGNSSDAGVIEKYYANDKVGFVIAKNGVTPNANGMIMSAKINCGISGHNHMDMLSMVTFLRGKPIVAEPYSGYLYHAYKMNSRQRGYCYNMESHNSVLCYGDTIQSWDKYANFFGVYRPDSPITKFVEYPEGMYVSAYHYGYTFCSHERRVLFSDSGNILLKDLVNRGNRLDKAHIQRWNFDPSVNVEVVSEHAALITSGDVRSLWVWDRNCDLKLFRQTEILSEYFSDENIGYTLDVSFKPIQADSHDKSMLVTLSLMMLDVTEKDGELDLERYQSMVGDLGDKIDTEEAYEILRTL